MRLLDIVQNMLFNGFRRNSVVRIEEDMDHYVLYSGAFRDEFEVKGKRAFYFCHAGTGYGSRTDSFQQATPILADMLMPGLIQHIIEYPNYVLERDYYGLPADCNIPASLEETEQKRFTESNADIILLMDYDHNVWTILLSENYPIEKLMKRLHAFCSRQKKGFRSYLT